MCFDYLFDPIIIYEIFVSYLLNVNCFVVKRLNLTAWNYNICRNLDETFELIFYENFSQFKRWHFILCNLLFVMMCSFKIAGLNPQPSGYMLIQRIAQRVCILFSYFLYYYCTEFIIKSTSRHVYSARYVDITYSMLYANVLVLAELKLH